MNTGSPSRWIVGAVILLGLLSLPRIEAGQIRTVGLEEMTQRADRIFSGRCVATTVMPDPQLGFDVTEVTFDVDRAIKGVTGRTITVRVLGARIAPGGAGREGIDVARFTPGERVVLFLYADSALGLTSPVGLGQGKFSIFEDKQGRELAVNAFGNKNLLGGRAARLAQLDGASSLSPAALLDGARDLLAIAETTPRVGSRDERGRGGR